jgi:hypothetical protein
MFYNLAAELKWKLDLNPNENFAILLYTVWRTLIGWQCYSAVLTISMELLKFCYFALHILLLN